MSELVARAWDAEKTLLTASTRRSESMLDQLLADDFREIGQSGRMWSKSEIIAELVARNDSAGATMSIRDARGESLSADTVLLTYLLSFEGRASRRTALWREEEQTLRCFFHQGTSVSATARHRDRR